jgi:hypothetical protein
VIGENRTPGTHRIGGNRCLLRKQAESDEALGQFAIGLFSSKFVSGMSSPEINPAAAKKFAGSSAEELNKGGWIGTIRGLGSNMQKQSLEGIVSGVRYQSPGRWRRIASYQVQSVTGGHARILVILTSY